MPMEKVYLRLTPLFSCCTSSWSAKLPRQMVNTLGTVRDSGILNRSLRTFSFRNEICRFPTCWMIWDDGPGCISVSTAL